MTDFRALKKKARSIAIAEGIHYRKVLRQLELEAAQTSPPAVPYGAHACGRCITGLTCDHAGRCLGGRK